MNGFTFGMFCGAIVCGITLTFCFILGRNQSIESTCQGTPWVIEKPLIKKTLTCVVELKEKK